MPQQEQLKKNCLFFETETMWPKEIEWIKLFSSAERPGGFHLKQTIQGAIER
jgi:hypothetical protein